MEVHRSNLVVSTFLLETEEANLADCSFQLDIVGHHISFRDLERFFQEHSQC